EAVEAQTHGKRIAADLHRVPFDVEAFGAPRLDPRTHLLLDYTGEVIPIAGVRRGDYDQQPPDHPRIATHARSIRRIRRAVERAAAISFGAPLFCHARNCSGHPNLLCATASAIPDR